MNDEEILTILRELSPEGREQLYKLLEKLRLKRLTKHQEALLWWERRIRQFDRSTKAKNFVFLSVYQHIAKEHPCTVAGHVEKDCPEPLPKGKRLEELLQKLDKQIYPLKSC